MPLQIATDFAFRAEEPTDVLLQFEAAMIPEQRLSEFRTELSSWDSFARIDAQDDIGDRLWVRAEGRFEASYRAVVEVDRLLTKLETLEKMDPLKLPGETVQYLFDSRYCRGDKFQSFVDAEFGDVSGGRQMLAMRDWIADNFTYAPGSSSATTTALDSFVERRGICRDYAHVMVTLARAAGVPARFVSCYAPDVTPPDFHAVAEVFLQDSTTPGGGAWYLLDATGMAEAGEIVKIGVGRDAADVSFMTSFGMTEFLEKTVTVTRV
ncbi:transglutaminase family protein [Qipengyuania sp. JC766]|uniref:transglutaminase-like domain-containing protein n=1 Tax=Qipengyuania sp. JC766 TaxID=3232139 RepID=UPI0034598E48